MIQHAGHASGKSIGEFVEYTTGRSLVHNWLFVAIDSLCGDSLFLRKQLIMKELAAAGVTARWRNGIWISAEGILAALSVNIPTLFSAAYLFEGEPVAIRRVTYDLTSDAGMFGTDAPAELRAEISELGACGYLSDGIGLNFYSVCPKLWVALGPYVEGVSSTG
jgi:hypothetical protein